MAPGQEGPVHQKFTYAHNWQEDDNFLGDRSTLYPVVTCNIRVPFYSQGGRVTQPVVKTCVSNRNDVLWIRGSRAAATADYLSEPGWDSNRDCTARPTPAAAAASSCMELVEANEY